MFKKMRSASNQGLLYESIKYFVDAVTEKFSRHDFKLRPSESRMKNIHFTITKNRGYFIFKQVAGIFELLNKTVEIVYQYCVRRSIFFRRTYYPYIKFLSETRCKYYHFAIFRYDYF